MGYLLVNDGCFNLGTFFVNKLLMADLVPCVAYLLLISQLFLRRKKDKFYVIYIFLGKNMTGYFIVGRKIIMRSFIKKASYVFSNLFIYLLSFQLESSPWPHAITSSFLSFKGDFFFFWRFIDIFTGIIVFFKTLFYDFFLELLSFFLKRTNDVFIIRKLSTFLIDCISFNDADKYNV